MSPNSQQTVPSPLGWKIPKIPITRSVLGLLIIGLTAYSIYVAVHEPDPQETLVLGQLEIASGSPAGLRILVRNRVSGKPVKAARIELSLVSKKVGTTKVATTETDATGSLAESVNIPDVPPGEYQFIIDTISPLGRDHVVKKVEIRHPAQILLSSDKPLYQPGQTIHVRTLVLNGRTERPFTNETVTFEVGDPRGNKVFKETRKTSKFGIASADFVLASEVNLGRYEIRALAGAAKVERTVEVKNYVLPKFKIQISTDKPYYLPGETVSGTLAANYFFGKSADNASVKLTAATLHEKPITIKELTGRTDAAGSCAFQFVLPDFFAGMPQKNEHAFLDLIAEVTDTAGHVEQKTLSLNVAQNDLEVTVIPEAGTLVPKIENILYILTSYPDGKPATSKIFVNGTAYQGGAQGVCEATVVPADPSQPFEIQAIDPQGRKGKVIYHSETNRAPPDFILRSDNAVYQVGQTARINIISSQKNDTIFLDVIKDGQTVLTKSISLASNKADYDLALPANLVGALKLNAYFITGNGEDRGCSRIIYVHPATGLRISAQLSQPTYHPGEIARLDFSVTDCEGKPAPSALGIAAVDESVFALHENRPGLLQQFLDAEGEVLRPRYQIKFFDSPSRLFDTENQSLATAYFASLEAPRVGPNLDDMVRIGYIPQKLIEHARDMRGSPAYERFRKDPQYADAFRLLENSAGVYSLREATGPVKLQAVEAHRRAYFKRLGYLLRVGFVGLLFLSPVLLLVHYSRRGAGVEPWTLDDGEIGYYVSVVRSLHNVLAVLILLPLICYPVGYMALEDSRVSDPGWLLLAFECVVVFTALFLQYVRTDTIGPEDLKREIAPLRTAIKAFFVQFVVSRTGFVLLSYYPQDHEGFAMLWVVASIAVPLMVFGTLDFHVRCQVLARGIAAKVGRLTFLQVLK